ncbi:protein kinase domain containing protein [Babesia divergens]|uniref:non-specific serine/threonine protein kinase n=1 Tax=Babesia divergens TaxID=32595 RepID=A0AAD9GFD9_BABDI|nr:protein kinase domain containing protein [Babesia divergens]
MSTAEERLSQFKTLRRIGAGRFGEVYQVQHKVTGELFCFKVVVYKGLSDKEKEQLVMEVNVMRDLKHPNIVRYVDRVVDRSKHLLYIIMEYCDSGDLAENMRQFHKHYEKVNEQVIFDIALQLLFALSYCHNSSLGPKQGRILHRDLKPQNIFLHSNNQNSNQKGYVCKIGDFGLCRSIGMESFAHSCVGTPYYWCPELLLSNTKNYDDKMDMWALGCVLYELSSGKTPFHKATTLAELAQQMKEGVPLPLPGRSRQLNSLLFALLQPDPRRRASAVQCLGLQLWDGPVSDWFWETVSPQDRAKVYNNIIRRRSPVASQEIRDTMNVETHHPRTPTTQKSSSLTVRTSTNFEDSDDNTSQSVGMNSTPTGMTGASQGSLSTPLSTSQPEVIAYNCRGAAHNKHVDPNDHVKDRMLTSGRRSFMTNSMEGMIDTGHRVQCCGTQRSVSEDDIDSRPRVRPKREGTPISYPRTPTQIRHEDTSIATKNVETVYSRGGDVDHEADSKTTTCARAPNRYMPIFRDDSPAAKCYRSRAPHITSQNGSASSSTRAACSRMKYIKEN